MKVDQLSLRRAADHVEALNGLYRTANDNEYGHLYRLVEGLEDMAASEFDGNPNWQGYLQRIARAALTLASLPVAPRPMTDEGYWERIAVSFETINGTVYPGDYAQRAIVGILSWNGSASGIPFLLLNSGFRLLLNSGDRILLGT